MGEEGKKLEGQNLEGQNLENRILESRTLESQNLGNQTNTTVEPVKPCVEDTPIKYILLAEDYKHNQIIMSRLLRKNNYENILVAEDGEEAIAIAKNPPGKIELILMDMHMPIMNGFDATERIREMPQYRDIPIIGLTPFAMKRDREKCLEIGCTDYISKPIDPQEFMDRVRYYTDRMN